MRLYFLALCLTGCGYQDVSTTLAISKLNDDVKIETKRFLGLCKKNKKKCIVGSLEVRWVETLPENRVGQCKTNWNGIILTQQIDLLIGMTTDWRLVYAHELTHCLRFVGHTPGDEPHIMRSYAMNEEERSQKTTERWIDESFKWGGKL